MASKTQLTWTSSEKNKLALTLHPEYGTNRTVWATWTKLSNVLSDSKYKKVGKLYVIWHKKLMDANGKTSWITMQSAQEISKSTIRSGDFSVPSDALAVRVGLKMKVSDDYKSKYTNSDYYYVTYSYGSVPEPSTPSEPSVTIDNGKVRITQTVTDDTVVNVQFIIYTEVGGVLSENPIETSMIPVPATKVVTYEMNATSGVRYYAKSVWYNNRGGSSESGGSGSAESEQIPGQITGLTVSPDTISTVRLNWNEDSAAAPTNGYEIEKATEYRYLGTSQADIVSSDGPPDILAVNTGVTWWFRVRARNRSGEYGDWSTAKSITVSTKPNPPTTWSLYSTYKMDDHIVLYWTYNSTDGSKPTQSKIYWRINQGALHTKTITHSYPEEQTEFTFSWDISEDPSFNIHDGDKITWYVVSYGIGPDPSEPSIEREFTVYTTPEVWVTFPSEIESYPIDIEINATPVSQNLVSGVIIIKNVDTYETVNRLGEEVIVNAGSTIYSQVFDGFYGNHFVMSLDPSNIELKNGETYHVYVKITMDSGLSADNSNQLGLFETNLEQSDYILDSGVVFNSETYAASLTPSCVYPDEDGEPTDELVPNVVLDVYRINSDGRLIEVTKNLPNDGSVTVLDPHPSLDTPCYRIVATDMATGFMYYMNSIGEETGVKGIVIQWDESYRNYIIGMSEDPDDFGFAYTGMTLELPFNVKTNDGSSKDVEFAEYIGREDPVSYYGTQQGKQATWSCEFDKTDKDTLFKLRHLDRWKQDVYVREQSGLGYWASVEVNYNLDYDNMVVPASFQITRVDSNKP